MSLEDLLKRKHAVTEWRRFQPVMRPYHGQPAVLEAYIGMLPDGMLIVSRISSSSAKGYAIGFGDWQGEIVESYSHPQQAIEQLYGEVMAMEEGS